MSQSKHTGRDTVIAAALIPLGLLLGYALVNWGGETRNIGGDAPGNAPDNVSAPAGEKNTFGDTDEKSNHVDVEESASVVSEVREEEKQAPLIAPPEAKEPSPVELSSELPLEKTGGMGDPEKRLPDSEQVPAEEIDRCDELIANLAKSSTPLNKKEGAALAGFEVELEGVVNPWSLMTISRLPEDLVSINVIENDFGGKYLFKCDSGTMKDAKERSATWEAPKKAGIYCLKIEQEGSDHLMCINVAVMEPWDGESESLNGYKIGRYEDKPYRDNPRYKKPRGFIEVTAENQDTWLSPHLQLSQFVCKQKSGFPKYMLVDTRLLLKLENLVAELERGGRDASHLYISSGYRTPAYNKTLGNKTIYSRHLYGDAADLFVDSNRDGKIDDLDFSGSTDDGDAKLIKQAVESVTERERYLKGGLGFYSVANYRNPFIHIDTRGYPARWSK